MDLQLLKEMLGAEHIFLSLKVADRFELIRTVAGRLDGDPAVKDSVLLAEDAITREEVMATGIEAGIALPHARTRAVERMVVSFVRPEKAIDFKSPDGLPADLVFFAAVPPEAVMDYLKLTATIVRRLQSPDAAEQLRKASEVEDIHRALGLS